MLNSILIVGGNTQQRQERGCNTASDLLNSSYENNPDFLLVEGENSITIAQARELQSWLNLKPYHPGSKVVLIAQAEKMTLPAQHSLLKTLEEPPNYAYIILTVPHKETILTTLVSRCQLVSLGYDTIIPEPLFINKQQQIAGNIIDASPGTRLIIAGEIGTDKNTATEFCENQLTSFRETLRQKYMLDTLPSDNSKLQVNSLGAITDCVVIRQIQNAIVLIKANVNTRLVVDNLLLSYPGSATMLR